MFRGEIMYQDFINYLEINKIIIVKYFENENRDLKNISETMVKEQIDIIVEFQNRTKGYNGYMNKRIENNTGKLVEKYKVDLKRVKKNILLLKRAGAKNEIESLILSNSDYHIEKAEESISNIQKLDYTGLLMRSMKNDEICLGKTYFDNLRKIENIQLIDVDKCCYNMIENDIIYFAEKLIKKNINLNYKKLIMYFCNKSNLGQDSYNFIVSALEYPQFFFKYCLRYCSNRVQEKSIVKKLNKSLPNGNNLI